MSDLTEWLEEHEDYSLYLKQTESNILDWFGVPPKPSSKRIYSSFYDLRNWNWKIEKSKADIHTNWLRVTERDYFHDRGARILESYVKEMAMLVRCETYMYENCTVVFYVLSLDKEIIETVSVKNE